MIIPFYGYVVQFFVGQLRHSRNIHSTIKSVLHLLLDVFLFYSFFIQKGFQCYTFYPFLLKFHSDFKLFFLFVKVLYRKWHVLLFVLYIFFQKIYCPTCLFYKFYSFLLNKHFLSVTIFKFQALSNN